MYSLWKEKFYEFEDGRFPRKVVDRIYNVNVRDHDMSFWGWIVLKLADIHTTTTMSMELVVVSSIQCLKEFYMDNLIHLIARALCLFIDL